MKTLLRAFLLILIYCPTYSQSIKWENRDVKIKIEYNIKGDSVHVSGAFFNKQKYPMYVPGHLGFIDIFQNLTFYRKFYKIEAGVLSLSFDNDLLEPEFILLKGSDSIKLKSAWKYEPSEPIRKLMLRFDYINPNSNGNIIRQNRKTLKNIELVGEKNGFQIYNLSAQEYTQVCDYIIITIE
jgi:hypothetical protein